MNRQESDVLNNLMSEPFINQRILADACGHSLGVINRSLKALANDGYIDDHVHPTAKAETEVQKKAPENAIILAAGFGMRMVPINTETPKALLLVNGEPLIERQIRQLHEAGINKIYVVVGFMKEQFEYLIDEFGVELIVNPYYASKNNLHSLNLALDHLSNSYIIPCDIWCDSNPFHSHELYSWYMVSDLVDNDSTVRVNRKNELVTVSDHSGGNAMIGISYLLEEDAAIVREQIRELCDDPAYDNEFWETALYQKDRMIIGARVISAEEAVEINTYEQLREFDNDSRHVKSNAISYLSKVFGVKTDEISEISVLKKGMTNRSFLFSCKGKKYIMRIPGEGTDMLINRDQEAAVYDVIRPHKICDDIIDIDPSRGYKVTAFLENARTCDAGSESDLRLSMDVLRKFHGMKLKVEHSFDIFGQIDFYETLWNGTPSAYRDYEKTKAHVLSLIPYIDAHAEEKILTHIDAVPDNFLFSKTEDGKDDVRLIDWEYAGMQDPHVDIAMFCIYALYDREECDRLIDIYFEGNCPTETRIKIYCYIAACGLLWSNWCEYKRDLGIEFGEYSLRQYRYAKDFYKIAVQEMKKFGLEAPDGE